MKKTLFNVRNAMLCIVIAGSVIAATTPVLANKENEPAKSSVSVQPVVSLMSNDASGSTFQVSFNPGVKTKFELVVTDSNNEIVFRKQYETDTYSSTLKLQNDAEGDGNYRISIQNLLTGEVFKYSVSSNIKWVKKVVVVKQ